MQIVLILTLSLLTWSSSSFSIPLRPPGPYDSFRTFLSPGEPGITNLLDIEMSGQLKKVSLSSTTWSGFHYPLYSGSLARPFDDARFPNSDDWYVNYNYYIQQVASGKTWSSPASKYDKLIGSTGMELTQSFWNQGKSYLQNGKVETWIGLCDGWAAASLYYPEPKSAVRLIASDGKTIVEFTAADVKALATALMAGSQYRLNFAGIRCEKQDAVGCEDNNPATLFLSAINLLGLKKKSFILDKNANAQVWNSPVVGYDFSYFNPKNLVPGDYDSSILAIEDYPSDPFSKSRSIGTAFIVGIKMNVTLQGLSGHGRGKVQNVSTYVFDLELDQSMTIIGGEWRQEAHPDFLWNLRTAFVPKSRYEEQKGLTIPWSPGLVTIGNELAKEARAAANKGQIYSSIVQELIRRSTYY